MRYSVNCVAARARVTPPHLRIGCTTLSFFFFHGFRGAVSESGTFSLRSPNKVVCTRQGLTTDLWFPINAHSFLSHSACRRFFRFSHSHFALFPLLYSRTTFTDKIARRFFCNHAQDNYTAKCGVHRWFRVGWTSERERAKNVFASRGNCCTTGHRGAEQNSVYTYITAW